jgi:hypothetical protein
MPVYDYNCPLFLQVFIVERQVDQQADALGQHQKKEQATNPQADVVGTHPAALAVENEDPASRPSSSKKSIPGR